MWAELQSIHDTYAQIVQGERPWTALGDFLNYWYTYAVDRREELIREPLTLPDNVTPELRQWAAFCAASVDIFVSEIISLVQIGSMIRPTS